MKVLLVVIMLVIFQSNNDTGYSMISPQRDSTVSLQRDTILSKRDERRIKRAAQNTIKILRKKGYMLPK